MKSSTAPGAWQFAARSERDTDSLGQALGFALESGGVVGLVGTLGAGKTRLAQAIAAALGVDRREVNSPTFVLIQEYEGRLPIFHCDAYRLRNAGEFLDVGADELFTSAAVCLVEWADRVADVLPEDRLSIAIEVAGPMERRFLLQAGGPRSREILAATRVAIQQLPPPRP